MLSVLVLPRSERGIEGGPIYPKDQPHQIRLSGGGGVWKIANEIWKIANEILYGYCAIAVVLLPPDPSPFLPRIATVGCHLELLKDVCHQLVNMCSNGAFTDLEGTRMATCIAQFQAML